MTFEEFNSQINDIKMQHPIWFELLDNNSITDDMIISVEKELKITLPEQYIYFLKKYSGGYFAFTIVLSCNPESDFYIVNDYSKSLLEKYKFLPLFDFENGDLAGVRVHNGKCSEKIFYYLHDTNELDVSDYDFFKATLHYGFDKKSDSPL